MVEPRYLGPFFLKIVQGVKIWSMLWVPDLNWQPGQEIPKLDPEKHPQLICLGVGLKNKCFKREEIPGIVSKLREAKDDVLLSESEITIPKVALKEIADEIDRRAGTIDIALAIKIAENYFKELYHEKETSESMGLPPNFSWISFEIVDATEESNTYIIKCEVKPNMFAAAKNVYVLKMDKRGVIKEIIKA